MADFNQPRLQTAQSTSRVEALDQGLRAYMLNVYNYMAGGLALTGLVAYFSAVSGIYLAVAGTPLIWVVMLAPLGMVFYLSARLHKMSMGGAQTAFWMFAALMGLSLSYVFLAYTGGSIARVFFITAASFGSLSLYGYTTKRDLSAMGSFLVMGVFGLIIAMLVNIFLQSSALDFAVSVLGVFIFAGLTAWDTQRIKEMYFEGDSAVVAGKKAIMGALSLYLDFINMFLFLLRFFGNRN